MIDSRVIKFFRKHHVLTIATTVNDEPWCANCFYVYLKEANSIVFTTDSDTRHGKAFLINQIVMHGLTAREGCTLSIERLEKSLWERKGLR